MSRLETVEQVVHAVGHAEELAEWDVSNQANGMVALNHGSRIVLVAGISKWSQGETLASLRESARHPGCTLLLLGTHEEFACLSSVEGQVLMPLPTSLPVLASTLDATLGSESQDLGELQLQLERARYESNLLVDIGRALSQERDTQRLLNLILLRAREVTGADAGSVYIVEGDADDPEDRTICFTESQNDSRTITSEGFTMPVSSTSIVGACVLASEVINIPDLYNLDPPGEGNNTWRFVHDKSFDEKSNYQSRSLLTIPMVSARRQVIGVIQLINRRKAGILRLEELDSFEDNVVPFDDESINYATTLASQACIALENSLLYHEVKSLFEGFVHASVTAIESRDPTTSGHSERVADLTVGLAKVVDRADEGSYSWLSFEPDDLKQIEYAALLHDFGKVGVREDVLVKSKKLYSHESAAIVLRFQDIRRSIALEAATTKVGYLLEASADEVAEKLKASDSHAAERIAEIDDFLNFILKANEPSVLEQGGFDRIAEIATRKYFNVSGDEHNYLSPEEVMSLQVARGSLTQDEREEIESHVVHTFNFLKEIPWGRTYRDIPLVAGAHHEKLDGSGYPHGLTSDQIPAPAKMMTISDIFDALTASDRPYKRAVPLAKALDILRWEVEAGKLCPELYEMFVEAKVYESVVSG
ncbi:MAG: GAF domain-containing protein [Myxococcales bacterium]|nr:GAF domain-containing protein [Myxococcales bacterium]